ncbi:MAG TPA: hypothetical protein VNS61_06225 [Caldimonas sp.]|nr:hypothetical protein [Caldimonas sp.]
MASPEKKAFLLRIDPAVWAEIERLAAAELRSANAQVEYLLRDALRARTRPPLLRGKDARGHGVEPGKT